MQQLHLNSYLQGGKYIIKQVLGQGGFGITYLAEHNLLGTKVAIKEFFMKELNNRDEATSQVSVGSKGSHELVMKFRDKFIKEARNIASLNHPNIIRIHDVFEENGTAYYVMEYCEGESLNELLKMHPAGLGEAMAVKYIRQVASALQYIHERKMNHLDVKPANILLDAQGNAVLIDFGLSKQYDAQGDQTSTTPIGVSHGYAPLEQYTGVSEFSPQSDVYSLAATFYKLLTGITPETAGKKQQPLPQSISPSIRVAIEMGMQVFEANRPQSIVAWLQLLDSSVKSSIDDESTQVLQTAWQEEEERRRKAQVEKERREKEEAERAAEKKRLAAEQERLTKQRKEQELAAKNSSSKALFVVLCIIAVIIAIVYFSNNNSAASYRNYSSNQNTTQKQQTPQSAQSQSGTQGYHEATHTGNNASENKRSFGSFSYEQYDNFRGYKIDYPTFMKPKSTSSVNGDGCSFYWDMRNYLTSYASWNALEESISDIFKTEVENTSGTIVYKVQKSNWFVISGKTSDGLIFYQKTVLQNDAIMTGILYHEEIYKEEFKPVIDHIFKKFPN